MAPLNFELHQVRKTQTFNAVGALQTNQRYEMRHNLTSQTEIRMENQGNRGSNLNQADAATECTGIQKQNLPIILSEET